MKSKLMMPVIQDNKTYQFIISVNRNLKITNNFINITMFYQYFNMSISHIFAS